MFNKQFDPLSKEFLVDCIECDINCDVTKSDYIKRLMDLAIGRRDFPISLMYCKLCFNFKSYELGTGKMASDLIKEYGEFGKWHNKQCPCYNYNGEKDMSENLEDVVENQSKVIKTLKEALYNAKVSLKAYGHPLDEIDIAVMKCIDSALEMEV